MKIFSAQQIKSWDAYTIQKESIRSIDLMERAAIACFEWILKNFDNTYSFTIFCGRGNNGGDGVAIARLLLEKNYKVRIIIVGHSKGSNDFEANLKKLVSLRAEITFLNVI